LDKQFALKMHERAGNLSSAWQLCARDLLFASDVLEERRRAAYEEAPIVGDLVPLEYGLHPAALMLKGMALECLLKGLWLIRGNSLVLDGKYIGVPSAGDHDLVQLAHVIGFKLTTLERDTARRLSCFIEYGGRYPIPRTAEKLMLIRSPTGGAAQSTHWMTPSDNELFAAVVDRLNELFDNPGATPER
jgi:hypothetical protein